MWTVIARQRETLLTIALCLPLAHPTHAAISTSGNVTPVPCTTPCNANLYVGQTADGMMIIDAESDAYSRSSYLGYGAGVTGSVMVHGNGSTWTNSGFNITQYVGFSGIGALDITSGGEVTLDGTFTDSYLGYNSGAIGEVTVDGTGSTWTHTGGLSNLFVGHLGAGILNVTGRGEVINTYGQIGHRSESTGIVTVNGIGSKWTNRRDLYVGRDGDGTLNITNGGTVLSSYPIGGDGDGYVAYNSGSSGAATVDGIGSSWALRGYNLYVGYYGAGTLDVRAGGTVSAATLNGSRYVHSYVGYSAESTGAVTVDGVGSAWSNTLDLYVGNYGTGTLDITNGGNVSSSTMYVGRYAGSSGTLTIDSGGIMDVTSAIRLGDTSTSNGTLNLFDGVLRMHGGLLSKGSATATFNFTGGRFEGAGTVDLGGPFVQNAGTLAPGNLVPTTIQGGYTLNAGTLEIEVNGLGSAGVDWDLLKVNGTVNLNGMLKVILGFAPTLNDQFLIMEKLTSGTIVGSFANGSTVKTPFNGMLYEFAINYTAGNGNDVALLTQAVSLLRDYGDFNGDAIVDSADYVIWRKGLDTIYTQADYAVWRANFGNSVGGSGSASNTTETPRTVPEPASAPLLVLALLMFSAGLFRCPRAKLPQSKGTFMLVKALILGCAVLMFGASATRAEPPFRIVQVGMVSVLPAVEGGAVIGGRPNSTVKLGDYNTFEFDENGKGSRAEPRGGSVVFYDAWGMPVIPRQPRGRNRVNKNAAQFLIVRLHLDRPLVENSDAKGVSVKYIQNLKLIRDKDGQPHGKYLVIAFLLPEKTADTRDSARELRQHAMRFGRNDASAAAAMEKFLRLVDQQRGVRYVNVVFDGVLAAPKELKLVHDASRPGLELESDPQSIAEKLTSEGLSTSEVAREMTANQVANKRGKASRWSTTSVKALMSSQTRLAETD